MKIFEYDDYKTYVRDRVASMPKKGRGQYLALAKALNIHTTLVSQIFKGSAQLNLDKALALCEHLGLNENESDFFLNLVERERAASKDLKNFISRKIKRVRDEQKKLSRRISGAGQAQELSDRSKAIFYSQWYYSAVRLLTSVDGFNDLDAVAEHFGIAKKKVAQVVEFLLENGLCVEKNGKLEMGSAHTHIPSDSPLINRHHINWRLKAMQKMESLSETDELCFTSPLSVSHEDAQIIREKLLAFIEEIREIVLKSKSERVACLNLDWFEVR